MIFQFGEYKIDVDVEKTRQFYDRAKTVSEGCQCDGCLNFERAVDKLPQNIRDFFSALGVDMKKICECYVYCAKDENTLYYGALPHLRNFTQRQKRVETDKRLYSLLGRKSNISALAEFWRFVQRPYRHAGAGFSSSSYSARLRCEYPVGARKEKQLY